MTLVVSAPQYASAPHSRTHRPKPARPYSEYRECLRLEFHFTCIYCLANEREVARAEPCGGFEIEHFKPKGVRAFRYLQNVYTNLLWACRLCNRAKRHRWPSDAEAAAGFRLIDPTQEALGDFIELTGSMVAEVAGSRVGRFTITVINLNSAAHVERRRQRKERMTLLAKCEATAATLHEQVKETGDAALQADLDHQVSVIEALRQDLGLSPHVPWDAPSGCRFACPNAMSVPNAGPHALP